MFHTSLELFGSAWAPIMTAADRLCTLSIAFAPELMQNWLNATSNGDALLNWKTKELLLADFEPLVHLINKKTETSTSTKHKSSSNNS